MKAYIVYLEDITNNNVITKILGVYSTEEKAIERVYDFEINEVDDMFSGIETAIGYEVNNHNNGYLEANIDMSGRHFYHRVVVDTKEVEMDENLDVCLS